MVGIVASSSILGLTMTSGLVYLANRLVDEFSHPHEVVNLDEFQLSLPSVVPEPPRTLQRPLTIQTNDGTLLCGDFWAQPQPAPTVVMCHGYRASRLQLRQGAAIEYSLGYNVLLFDFRGHGDSDSIITSGGNAEVRDLETAISVAYLQPETLPRSIILHGFSMGAAIALLLPPRNDVAAIIADSPFARSDEILMRLINHRLTERSLALAHMQRLRSLTSPFAWTLVNTSKVVFRARFGYTFVARPDISFKRWGRQAKEKQLNKHIPILLIHALGDNLIPISHATTLVERAKASDVPIETYFVDHPTHCGAFIYDPEQYKTVIQQFLTRHTSFGEHVQHSQGNSPPLSA